ncbi:MAG: glutamate--tRNA ligase [Verrucomicrobiales bacterium]
MPEQVRVRFAPSPTGHLHIGGARTALFNWLYARHCGGVFVLRVEDTDESRNTQEANRAIFDGLSWLGIDWDEGPEQGGDHGPYRQSERKAVYDRYLGKLEEQGLVYDDGGALRFRAPNTPVTIDDAVCGAVEFADRNDPDMTIRRPDGSYIFHFVNVVDDIEMRISHVIRGEDHLSNTPKHIDLYQAFGAPLPSFAHIPLILNGDGSKMSKRDRGASVREYIEGGYLPAAVRNYISLLGWSPKDDREIIPTEEIIEIFELAQINRSHARFDLEKCLWMNQQYLMHLSPVEFHAAAAPFLESAGVGLDLFEAPERVLALYQEKVSRLADLPGQLGAFAAEEVEFDSAALERLRTRDHTADLLTSLAGALESLSLWSAQEIESILQSTAQHAQVKPGALMLPTRVAASGCTQGPALFPMLELLGRERVVARIRRTVDLLQ